MGFLSKISFVLKGVRESLSEGKSKCLKNYHICIIKLKTHVFCGLGSSEPVAKMTIKAKKLLREAFGRETIEIQ